MYKYEFPRPRITVDVVILKPSSFEEYEVLLVKRKQEPYKGLLALPGGHLEIEIERIHEAACREVLEETGLHIRPSHLRFVNYYDSLKRHPYDRVITFGFVVLLDSSTTPEIKIQDLDEVESCSWYKLEEAKNLAYDHDKILEEAMRLIGRINYV